ncbi:hypothetical protein D6855_15620 [Butyrivibrio sp. CB08]|uniref:hypothetical protein n=1 Tax=Butyrivibrio sp. CB08 TaxID=2364879 RepID=UPI000EAA1153|nr:hypothetical protein [Butyrivibrio sp. CB08]RKM55952.1 hypothetical protein D6855_15620 [Butyrivibrio sp. CB08]
MKLYDNMIDVTMEALSHSQGKRVAGSSVSAWKCLDNSEFIMQRDAGLELGGAPEPSVNYTCVSTSGKVTEDEILVYGRDISEITGGCGFARVVVLETEDLGEEADTEKAFQAIRNLEFVRYHVFPEGYMVRVSSQSNQEQVRISREALKKGISFASVGAAYIAKYKAVEGVKNVRIIFITESDLVKEILPNADKVDAITKTLTHILDGMPTDCGHCSMKPVCDEVEGMKELHLGKKH